MPDSVESVLFWGTSRSSKIARELVRPTWGTGAFLPWPPGGCAPGVQKGRKWIGIEFWRFCFMVRAGMGAGQAVIESRGLCAAQKDDLALMANSCKKQLHRPKRLTIFRAPFPLEGNGRPKAAKQPWGLKSEHLNPA